MKPAMVPYVSRWDGWWRWTVASTVGAVLAALLFALMPRAITYPRTIYEDYDYLAAPWRYLVIYGAIYGALSGTQAWVLRRYVRDAWQWVAVTMGSAALLFPAIIWLFETIGLGGIAWLVWAPLDLEAGLGGHLFVIISQWFVLRQWMRWAWPWLLVGPIVGVATMVGASAFLVRLEPQFSFHDPAFYCLWATLHYALMGVVLVGLLDTYGVAPSTSLTTRSLR